MQQLRIWRQDTLKEIEVAQREQASVQKHLEEARERLSAIDRLISLHGSAPQATEEPENSIDLLDVCERLLREAGEPMHVSKLHAALLDAGIPIPGPWDRGERDRAFDAL